MSDTSPQPDGTGAITALAVGADVAFTGIHVGANVPLKGCVESGETVGIAVVAFIGVVKESGCKFHCPTSHTHEHWTSRAHPNYVTITNAAAPTMSKQTSHFT